MKPLFTVISLLFCMALADTSAYATREYLDEDGTRYVYLDGPLVEADSGALAYWGIGIKKEPLSRGLLIFRITLVSAKGFNGRVGVYLDHGGATAELQNVFFEPDGNNLKASFALSPATFSALTTFQTSFVVNISGTTHVFALPVDKTPLKDFFQSYEWMWAE